MSTPIDRVRQVMASSGLPQGQFAAVIGFDALKISKSLSGKRRFSPFDCTRIAEQGSVTVDLLPTGELAQSDVAARAAEGQAADAALAKADLLVELREVWPPSSAGRGRRPSSPSASGRRHGAVQFRRVRRVAIPPVAALLTPAQPHG